MMLSSLRTAATRRILAGQPSTSVTGARWMSFKSSVVALSAVKPGSESEATTPGAGSTEDIANSKAAYDGSSTNPDTSTSQIESETHANFNSSSANRKTSEMATKTHHQSNRRPSKQQQHKPDRTDFGATEARKQGGRGGSGA
ncbi:uncharacterized protein UTRI_10608_B [Ustilago trichophora]|uniref:Uncharacterized protein n=1 Tax=Ustilago trichophora TaxID=86804 RepID=A0A5C3EC43_9BASI|nr:uncharacterized protein UTRI_10608_B [Ustilago trichophora]